MAHPTQDYRNGHCRVCGDRLSKVVDRSTHRLYRRHLTNNNCSTKGRGQVK